MLGQTLFAVVVDVDGDGVYEVFGDYVALDKRVDDVLGPAGRRSHVFADAGAYVGVGLGQLVTGPHVSVSEEELCSPDFGA